MSEKGEVIRAENSVSQRRFFGVDGIAIGLLLAATVAVHRSILTGWWRWDDSQILIFVRDNVPVDYFFRPERWQMLSPSNFTPLLALSYELDLGLFGLEPAGFYAHHLGALVLVVLAGYVLFRQFAAPAPAFLGSLLFAAGVPVRITAQQLMTRHYIEGLLLAILAILCFLEANRRNRFLPSLAGAALYLLAIAAKEVFVPVPLVLLAIPQGSWRRRLRCSAPYWLLLFLYLPWRLLMLGGSPGGYDHLRVGPWDVLRLPWAIWQAVFGSPAAAWCALVLLGLLAARLWGAVDRRWMMLAAAIAAAVFAPVVPVAGMAGEPGRLSFVAWWVLCLVVAFLVQHRWHSSRGSRGVSVAVCGALAVVAVVQGTQVQRQLQPLIRQFEAEGRFVWENWNRSIWLFSPRLGDNTWYHAGLIGLREPEAPAAIRVWVDPIELQRYEGEPPFLWAYDGASGSIRHVGPAFEEVFSFWQDSLEERPISVELLWEGNQMSWGFGPYAQGNYSLVFRYDRWPSVSGALYLPQRGRLRTPEPFETMRFFLRYDSPEGWITYSPELKTFPGNQEWFRWERGTLTAGDGSVSEDEAGEIGDGNREKADAGGEASEAGGTIGGVRAPGSSPGFENLREGEHVRRPGNSRYGFIPPTAARSNCRAILVRPGRVGIG